MLTTWEAIRLLALMARLAVVEKVGGALVKRIGTL